MRTASRFLALLAALILCGLPASSQEKTSKDAKPAQKKTEKAKPAGAGAMPMPKPSPEMTKLIKTLAGTWNTSEKMEPSEFAPQGGTSKGRAVLRPGPGGLSLVEDYQSEGSTGKFRGHGVFWWDDKAKAYTGIWCDNMTPKGCDNAGTSKWEGEQLVGHMEGEMMGKKTTMKGVYSNITPTSFTFTMDSSMDGSPMKRTMTIEYTKAEGKAAEAKPAAKKD